MLGKSIASGYVSLAAIVLVLRHVFRSSGVQLVLGNVHTYFVKDPTAQPTQSTQASRQQDTKGKKGKKAGNQTVAIQGTSEEVMQTKLSPRSLATLTFADEINTLVTMGLAVVLNGVYVVLLALLLGVHNSTMTAGISLILVAYTVSALIRVDYRSQQRGWADKAVLLGLLLFGFFLSMFSLTWAPKIQIRVDKTSARVPLLAWDINKAAGGLAAIIHGIHKRVAARLNMEVEPPAVHPYYIATAVSVWAGMLAVALLGPALQYTRQFYSSTHYHRKLAPWVQKSWFSIKLLQLGFALPIIMVVSQVPVLTRYIGLPISSHQLIAGCLLLAIAAVHSFTTRTLAQTYLDGGLKEWFILLHNGRDFTGKAAVVRARLDFLRSWMGKVAVQLVSLPLLAVSLGLLLLLHCGIVHQAANQLAGPRQAVFSYLPEGLANYLNSMADNATQPYVASTHMDITPTVSVMESIVQTMNTDNQAEELLGLTEDGSSVSLPSRPAATMETPSSAPVSRIQGSPDDFWVFLSSYYGWWACLVWACYACATLVVYRLGLHSG